LLELDLDRQQFEDLRERFPKRHRQAMVAALRSESWRLNDQIRRFARRHGEGSWQYSPITKLLRKGRGYGAWVARFARYHVDPQRLTAWAGLIGRRHTGWSGARGQSRFKPISAQFVASAERLAGGYRKYVSREHQKHLAARLLSPGAQHFARYKTLKGAQRRFDALARAIPRVGWRTVRARPFVEPVFARERGRVGRNLQALYLTKLAGARYSKNWVEEWGARD
jgi:hypothetical protein